MANPNEMRPVPEAEWHVLEQAPKRKKTGLT